MPNLLTLETTKYKVKLENFEGPLDLLCHLIDKNKMNIYEINLSEITDQYIEYINHFYPYLSIHLSLNLSHLSIISSISLTSGNIVILK